LHKQHEPKSYTLQLTTLGTSESESLQKYDGFVVILSQRLLHLQDIIACSLMYMQVWPLSKM